jgi:hypothetical protein
MAPRHPGVGRYTACLKPLGGAAESPQSRDHGDRTCTTAGRSTDLHRPILRHLPTAMMPWFRPRLYSSTQHFNCSPATANACVRYGPVEYVSAELGLQRAAGRPTPSQAPWGTLHARVTKYQPLARAAHERRATVQAIGATCPSAKRIAGRGSSPAGQKERRIPRSRGPDAWTRDHVRPRWHVQGARHRGTKWRRRSSCCARCFERPPTRISPAGG